MMTSSSPPPTGNVSAAAAAPETIEAAREDMLTCCVCREENQRLMALCKDERHVVCVDCVRDGSRTRTILRKDSWHLADVMFDARQEYDDITECPMCRSEALHQMFSPFTYDLIAPLATFTNPFTGAKGVRLRDLMDSYFHYGVPYQLKCVCGETIQYSHKTSAPTDAAAAAMVVIATPVQALAHMRAHIKTCSVLPGQGGGASGSKRQRPRMAPRIVSHSDDDDDVVPIVID